MSWCMYVVIIIYIYIYIYRKKKKVPNLHACARHTLPTSRQHANATITSKVQRARAHTRIDYSPSPKINKKEGCVFIAEAIGNTDSATKDNTVVITFNMFGCRVILI